MGSNSIFRYSTIQDLKQIFAHKSKTVWNFCSRSLANSLKIKCRTTSANILFQKKTHIGTIQGLYMCKCREILHFDQYYWEFQFSFLSENSVNRKKYHSSIEMNAGFSFPENSLPEKIVVGYNLQLCDYHEILAIKLVW